MRRSHALTIPLLLVLAGCHRSPYGPGAESLGGTNINGRSCKYLAADRQIEYVVVFDTELHIGSGKSRMLSGKIQEVEQSFRTLEGQNFSVQYRYSGSVSIDGKDYQIQDGRVFLIRFSRGQSECEQLSISFPPCDGLPDEAYVRDELLKAAEKEPRLGVVLKPERK